PDGKKRWGEKRGGKHLAADDQYVYAMAEGWHIKEPMLIRLDRATGKYAPFVRNGEALPLEVPLETIFDGKAPGKAVALAAGKDVLAMATSEGGLVLLDPATATIRQRVDV